MGTGTSCLKIDDAKHKVKRGSKPYMGSYSFLEVPNNVAVSVQQIAFLPAAAVRE